jgi:aspartyl/asparaginyl beta-hydroxylase (cupin superfamily)
VVRRQLRDLDGAFQALREALAIDNRNFPALLMQAALLDKLGRDKDAAAAYGIALVQAPPDSELDAPTQKAVARAREVHARHVGELGEYIRERVAPARDALPGAARRRLESFIDTTLRTRKRYRQEPMEYWYPGLPDIEFYEREEFPWLADFEAATPGMQRELGRILVEDEAGFSPYIHYEDHLPLDQWRELNKSPRWSAFHFYDKGRPIEERCARAPATMAAVRALPQAEVELRSPTAMFSVLKPKTRIPPHTGIANFRLVVHLPLVLPAHCGFRVGGETREWRIGEAWVFDDTIEHEAWNDSDETRIILICDVWSPRLSPEEREAIRAVIAATDAYRGGPPAAQI